MQTTIAQSTLVEVTAPVRRPGESEAQTLFVWMRTNRYLWMLQGGPFADRTEEIVGTKMLINLVGLKRRWIKGRKDHPTPEDDGLRKRAFSRLERFLQLHIHLDSPPFNASAAGPNDVL